MRNQGYFEYLIDHPKLSDEIKHELRSSATVRFFMEEEKADEDVLSILGGYPLISKSESYPSINGHFYEFVCQINLAEIERKSILPTKGLLSFYVLDDTYRTNVPNKVKFDLEMENLATKKPNANLSSLCESFDSRSDQKTVKIKLEPSYSIPEELITKVFDLIQDEEIFSKFNSTNQLLGHEIGWREPDYKWKAYLSKNGFKYIYPYIQHHQLKVYKGNYAHASEDIRKKVAQKQGKLDETIKKYESHPMSKYWKEELSGLENQIELVDDLLKNYEDHVAKSKEWIHLLGLYSSTKAALNFGSGKMQFFINKEDLLAKDFTNVYCDICN